MSVQPQARARTGAAPTTTDHQTASTKESAMTTETVTTPGAPHHARRAGAARRVGSLVRAEVLLLVRNRTTLFNAVALAPLTVAFIAWTGGDGFGVRGEHMAALVVTMLVVLGTVVVVYYNLTTTLVARREDLVLKRFLTGEVSRVEVLLACATPAVLILLAQVVLGIVAATVSFEQPPVQNIGWLLLGLAGGVVAFALLAVVSSGVTRTVESAQLTTLPVLMVTTALSNAAVPLHIFPDVVEQIAAWTPMYPVVSLLQHGFGAMRLDGTVASGALTDVAQPLLCLALWIVVGALAARRWMRWEPRR